MRSKKTLGLISVVCGTLIVAAAACSKSTGGSDTGTPTGSATPTGTPLPANTFQWTDPGFSVPAGTQFYECFYVDVPTGTGLGAIEFSYDPSIILHHMVVFTTEDTSNSGPTGTNSNCINDPFNENWTIRYAGGTHTGPLTLPTGVAMPMDNGVEHFIIQLHLLNASTSAVTDNTKVNITLTAPGVTFTDAGVMLSGATGFSIPEPETPYSVVSTCGVPAGTATVNLFAVWPHMHLIGESFSILDKPAVGSPFTMLDVNWDFNSQPMWFPTNALTVSGGDVLTTTCTWLNNTGHVVDFGELSTDEMCFDFFYYYPADPSALEIGCSNAFNEGF